MELFPVDGMSPGREEKGLVVDAGHVATLKSHGGVKMMATEGNPKMSVVIHRAGLRHCQKTLQKTKTQGRG